MNFPELNEVRVSTAIIDSFGGLDKRPVITAGEFADCMNISNDRYPALCLRQKRAILSRYTDGSIIKSCKALFYNESLGYLCDSDNGDGTRGYIYYGGNKYVLPFTFALDDVSIANMGRRVIINNAVPNRKKGELCVFDLNDNKVQAVGNEYSVSNETNGSTTTPLITGGSFCHIRVRYEDDYILIPNMGSALDAASLESMSSRSDNVNHLIAYGEKPRLGCVWYRITKDGGLQVINKLKYEFCAPDIHLKFNTGDYVQVTMSGAFGTAPNHFNELSLFNGWYEVIDVKTNIITVLGDVQPYDTMNALFITRAEQRADDGDNENNLYLDDGAKIERSAPKLAYICESNNRIWGCGFDNQIYACELGNPYNWYRYEGTLMDSYAVSTGEDGDWTAAFSYLDTPVFFKEDMMYRVTGDDPSSFYVYKYTCRGVAKTCYNSLCVVNDILYYQASDGIYRYNQSTPYCVSEKVHTASWRVGKAGKYKDKYMLSVIDDKFSNKELGAYEHNRELYSFDTVKGTWQKEDPIYAYDFVSYDNTLYILESTAADAYTVYVLDEKESFDEYEGRIRWYAETGVLTAGETGRNYIRKIRVDATLSAGSEMSVYIQYNGDGRWIKCQAFKEQKRNTLSIQIRPRRCDNVRLRFEGKGEFELYAIVLTYTKGSDKK